MTAGAYDVVVVGSGFGGSVMACRLAQQGRKVLVLERGRRWKVGEYPRLPSDPWLFRDRDPARSNGLMDVGLFGNMIVVQGAGVGGGSLVYSAVLLEADREIFRTGWPKGIDHDALAPWYDIAARMLSAEPVPEEQWTERTRILQESAIQGGYPHRFQRVPVGIAFDPDWRPTLDNPYSLSHSRTFVNPHGATQGTCVHLGNCNVGCDAKAKNTLEFNYLALAEAAGAEVLPLHLVDRIAPDTRGGYRVAFQDCRSGEPVLGEVASRQVIVAGGSLGSTRLLLRCRDVHGTLPDLGPKLGYQWSSNGNFMSSAEYSHRPIDSAYGPRIGSGMDFRDGAVGGARFYLEDDSAPDVIQNALQALLAEGARHGILHEVLEGLAEFEKRHRSSNHVMSWFAMGEDASNGRLHLDSEGGLALDWDPTASRALFDTILATQTQLQKDSGGDPSGNRLWSLLRVLFTVQPLGGCPMADSPADGVVNASGEVFGHPGLHVIDGAMIPMGLGVNPALTIAALAERIAKGWIS